MVDSMMGDDMPKTESGKLCGPIRFEISTILCEICDGHKNSYVKSWEDECNNSSAWQSCEVFRSAPREAPPEFVLPVNTALRVKACSGGADMGRKDGKTYIIGAPKTQKRVLKMGATPQHGHESSDDSTEDSMFGHTVRVSFWRITAISFTTSR